MSKLTKYADSLPPEAKRRYSEKINLIGNIDPYSINEIAKSTDSGVTASPLPPVDSSDLVSYLVLQTSFVTVKQFKAHKSMETFNQFVCGWVKGVRAWKVSGKCVVIIAIIL